MTSLALSHSATHLKRSVMRNLIALAGQPDIISFAGGLPAADHLPLAQIQTCVDAVLTRDGAKALQYGPQYGPLREWIAGYMQRRGVPCTADNIFITNGGQQGLEVLARLLLDTGDTALVEAITFTGITQVMNAHAATLRPIAINWQTGVEVDALEAGLTAAPRARLAVVIPDFHNPLGVSVPPTNRARLAALAARYNIPIIEDDPYSLLRYSGDIPAPIKAYDDAGLVFYLGSFSKILAPAMRLGWIVAPADIVPKLIVLRESIDLESSQLLQRAAAEFLERGYLPPHLQGLNAANRERRDALFAALDRELGDVAEWSTPDGGLFTWVSLPTQVDTSALFDEALQRKVAFIPGAHFGTPEGEHKNTLRLNYSNTLPDNIHEGLRRLGAVIRAHL
jgi:2-aminoadipate transaminase